MTTEKIRAAAACRAARALHGMSQAALGERAGVPESAIRAIEAARRDDHRAFHLRICNSTGLSLQDWTALQEIYARSVEAMHAAGIFEPQ